MESLCGLIFNSLCEQLSLLSFIIFLVPVCKRSFFSNFSASDQLYVLVLVLFFVCFFSMWSNCIKYLLYLFCYHMPIIWEDQDCVVVTCPNDTCCQCRCFVAQFCQFVKHIFMFGFSVLNSILFLFSIFFLFGFFLFLISF